MKSLNLELSVPVTTLVLIGGGEFSFGETREVDEFLVGLLPPERRSVAFLPTASGSAEYAQHLGRYFREIAPDVETTNVPIYRGRDVRRQKSLNAMLSAGLVYIGGGTTNNLIGTMRETAAELALREAAANGVTIAAIGAAASSFGTCARDMRGVTTSIPAFGWLKEAVVEGGFEETALRRLMSLPEVRLGIGIPAGTALVVRGDGSTQVIGSGQIAAYRKA